MRALSALCAFVFVGLLTAVVFVLLGNVTGWLTVHGTWRGPLWWHYTYLAIALCATPAIAVASAIGAWKSGRPQ